MSRIRQPQVQGWPWSKKTSEFQRRQQEVPYIGKIAQNLESKQREKQKLEDEIKKLEDKARKDQDVYAARVQSDTSRLQNLEAALEIAKVDIESLEKDVKMLEDPKYYDTSSGSESSGDGTPKGSGMRSNRPRVYKR